MQQKRRGTTIAALAGVAIVLIILVAGMMWMGNTAKRDTDSAVRAVSLLYLDELAGRREQVVAANLQNSIDTIQTAVGLMTEEDLSDEAHRQAYQTRMKALYRLDRFGLVGESGVFYLSSGQSDGDDSYRIDYQNMSEPQIAVTSTEDGEKEVTIAAPIEHRPYQGDMLVACFMQISMDQLLEGVSMKSSENDATFCNIYTNEGMPLSRAVLGGLAEEDNLLAALGHAKFEDGYTFDKVVEDFARGTKGVASFEYGSMQETLAYVPVEGTDWMLTYLIRESLISDEISSISNGIIIRSVIQSLLVILALVAMFVYIISKNRKNAKILLEKEASATEARVKQEEMEQRLALKDELLRQKEQGQQKDRMIKALSSDYRSVYYLELDKDEGVCYQARTDLPGFENGETFHYLEAVTAYCNQYVLEPYRDDFLAFIHPDAVRKGLEDRPVISYRYMISVGGEESWEAVKFASVRHPDERAGHLVHSVGACFADVDAETRKDLEQKQALSDALELAERANRAKTAFLSNMSHEIRTPMNAIIGLDNIALNDPDTPDKTKEYLSKIGDSAEHLLGLINDILDMSRIESGRLTLKNEEFSFAKLLETINMMVSGQCDEKGLEYQCRMLSEVDDCYIGDGMKLRQVLINILGNAIKFTPQGGAVELAVEKTAQFEDKSTLRFTIADTGIGISEEFLPKLFDAFSQEDSSTTSKYGSTGLGLAITKNIVEMMNGSIEVSSTKGVGTTFSVSVTLLNAAKHDSEEFEIRPEELGVLIVDDDPVACEHARLVLEKAGIAADVAQSGSEAIEMVQLRHARRDSYNLMLVDWQMPEMDGIETARRMREIVGPETAIIILTAYRWDDVLEEAFEAGADSFIPKPLFVNTLFDELRSAMRRKSIASGKLQNKADLTGRRILVAEDVQINAEILLMVLQAREMEAELAVNGRIAVEMFESHEPGYYDAILMDMRMPEMDGLEATRTIRALDRADASEIPIIALTANAFDEDVQRSLQAGLDAHLSKPVQPEALYETLESLIKS